LLSFTPSYLRTPSQGNYILRLSPFSIARRYEIINKSSEKIYVDYGACREDEERAHVLREGALLEIAGQEFRFFRKAAND
jgi:hypothetical protein